MADTQDAEQNADLDWAANKRLVDVIATWPGGGNYTTDDIVEVLEAGRQR